MPEEIPMEAQLRDMAFLLILALLFVITLQILRLTGGEHRHQDEDG